MIRYSFLKSPYSIQMLIKRLNLFLLSLDFCDVFLPYIPVLLQGAYLTRGGGGAAGSRALVISGICGARAASQGTAV
jgi:hypothetical protein